MSVDGRGHGVEPVLALPGDLPASLRRARPRRSAQLRRVRDGGRREALERRRQRIEPRGLVREYEGPTAVAWATDAARSGARLETLRGRATKSAVTASGPAGSETCASSPSRPPARAGAAAPGRAHPGRPRGVGEAQDAGAEARATTLAVARHEPRRSVPSSREPCSRRCRRGGGLVRAQRRAHSHGPRLEPRDHALATAIGLPQTGSRLRSRGRTMVAAARFRLSQAPQWHVLEVRRLSSCLR